MPTNKSFSDEYYKSLPSQPNLPLTPLFGAPPRPPGSPPPRQRPRDPRRRRRRQRGWTFLLVVLVVLVGAGSYNLYFHGQPLRSLVAYIKKEATRITATSTAPSPAPSAPNSPAPPALKNATAVLANADGPARALTGAAALAVLNHQRAVNGIPPIRDLQQSYASTWCPNEDQGRGYGEKDTARDLSSTTMWDTTLSPWDSAPNYQLSLFEPVFTAGGTVDVNNWACFGLGAVAAQPHHLAFYAYTSDNGRTLVPPTETVSHEAPFAPQQYVGIRQGVATGPQLLLYAEGFPGEYFLARGARYAVRALS